MSLDSILGIHARLFGCPSKIGVSIGRIERGLVVLRCVLWMFATVLYSINFGMADVGARKVHIRLSMWGVLVKHVMLKRSGTIDLVSDHDPTKRPT